VDPQGSGMEYSGHLGHFLYNAHRCCKNCQIIFAAWTPGGDNQNAGFIDRELTPVNAEARRILADIKASDELKRVYQRSSWAVAEPSA
jgi:hypothetical protein